MRNLENYYRNPGPNKKAWSAGPHLFIADDLIWVFTPLTTSGVHSPSWNLESWGVEMVGDYNREPFNAGVRANTVDALAILHAWCGLNPDTIRFHKEDPLTTHDCPGHNVSKSSLIEQTKARLAELNEGEHSPAENDLAAGIESEVSVSTSEVARANLFEEPLELVAAAPSRLPTYARGRLDADSGIPWHRAKPLPEFNGYSGLLSDSFHRFDGLQGMPAGVTQAIYYESMFGIDSDGVSGSTANDPDFRPNTSLKHADGKGFNAYRERFAVLPLDAAEAKKSGLKKHLGLPDFSTYGLKLGDVGIAFWKEPGGAFRFAPFIYADKGPPNQIGEGSVRLAGDLGINNDPSGGGYNAKDVRNLGFGIIHIVFPDSSDMQKGKTIRSTADSEQLALSLFEAFRAQ